MKPLIIRKAGISRGTRSKGSMIPVPITALAVINGVKFTSEEPINDNHADHINSVFECAEVAKPFELRCGCCGRLRNDYTTSVHICDSCMVDCSAPPRKFSEPSDSRSKAVERVMRDKLRDGNDLPCIARGHAAELDAAREVLRDIAEMPEYDQDDHCRLRQMAKKFLSENE